MTAIAHLLAAAAVLLAGVTAPPLWEEPSWHQSLSAASSADEPDVSTAPPASAADGASAPAGVPGVIAPANAPAPGATPRPAAAKSRRVSGRDPPRAAGAP